MEQREATMDWLSRGRRWKEGFRSGPMEYLTLEVLRLGLIMENRWGRRSQNRPNEHYFKVLSRSIRAQFHS
jgi:hypothetical protein